MARRQSRRTTDSNTYRFFVPPAAIEGGAARLDDPALARQIGAVLRLGPGDRVVLLDDTGWEYIVRLDGVGRSLVTGTVERRDEAQGEPRAALTLFAGLMRAERFEWLLQKGTELGVSAFAPVICERSAAEDMGARKAERWGRIIREAAEQSRRGRLPQLRQPLRFSEACAAAASAGPALLLWEGQGAEGLRPALGRLGLAGAARPALAILSGPEGGLSEGERHEAERHGIMPVTLGPRTLRAETAPIAAAAAAMYELGEL